MRMRFFNLVFVTAAGLLDAIPSIHAAATAAFVAPFSEKFCDAITNKLCHNDGGYRLRYSVYDPTTRTCACSINPSTYIISKRCRETTCPSITDRIYYWPSTGECFCEAEGFLAQAWNAAGSKSTPIKDPVAPAEQFTPFEEKLEAFNYYLQRVKVALGNADPKLRISQLRALNKQILGKRRAPRQVAPTSHAVESAVPTFIPPPKTDITPQLIDQSLAVQPQNTATISSVRINIPAGVVTFYFQLNGIVADTLAVNASTSMVCGTIGIEPEPDIQLVPKYVHQGQGVPETIVADCLCFAINMLNPDVINFYVLNQQGKIFSLTGSNKILDIDKLDTSQPLALTMVPIVAGTQKRNSAANVDVVPLKPRQVLSIRCGQPCPFAYMHHIRSANGDCGCVFDGNDGTNLHKRGVSAPDMYTATMSKAACESMTCTDNGGKPAMFNPFSLTCFCVDPVHIENNPNAWKAPANS